MKKKTNFKKKQRLKEKKSAEILGAAAAWFFIAITAVFPLFLSQTKYSNMTFQKTLFFWLTTAAAGFAVFCIFVFVKKSFSMKNYDTDNEPKRPVSIPEWALAAFISLSFLSAFAAFFNANPISGLYNAPRVADVVWTGVSGRYEGFLSFLGYALTFVIIARFYKYRRWHLTVLAASAILVCLYGILQFLGVDIFGLFPFKNSNYSDYGPLSAHFRTTLGNVNIVTAYCSFTVVLFAALFAASKSKSKRNLIYIPASALAFMLILITGDGGDAGRVAILFAMVLLIPYWISNRERFAKILIILSSWCAVYAAHDAYVSVLKNQYETNPELFAPRDGYFLKSFAPANPLLLILSAFILLAAGLFLLFFLKKWAERPLKTAGVLFLPAILIGGVLFVLFMGSRWSDNPNNIIWQAREILRGNFGDRFGSGRGWIWKNAAAVLFDRPLLGSGPDTFFYALGDARQTEAFALFAKSYDKAHNIFLQIAICMGLPAVLSYIAFVGSLFLSAIKKAFERPLLLAFGAAALSYMIQSFFCVEVPITTPLVWAAFGVVAREIWLEKIGVRFSEV